MAHLLRHRVAQGRRLFFSSASSSSSTTTSSSSPSSSPSRMPLFPRLRRRCCSTESGSSYGAGFSAISRLVQWVLLPEEFRSKGKRRQPRDGTVQRGRKVGWWLVRKGGEKVSEGSAWVVHQVEHRLHPCVGAGLLWVATVGAMVLCAPTLPFNLAAGAVFGVRQGSLLILSAVFTGAVLDFLLARSLFKDYASLCLDACDCNGAATPGAEHCFLLRVCPFFPAGVVSYALGATSMDTWQYVVGTGGGQLLTVYLFSRVGHCLRRLSGEQVLLRRAALKMSLATNVGIIVSVAGVASLELSRIAKVPLVRSLLPDLA